MHAPRRLVRRRRFSPCPSARNVPISFAFSHHLFVLSIDDCGQILGNEIGGTAPAVSRGLCPPSLRRAACGVRCRRNTSVVASCWRCTRATGAGRNSFRSKSNIFVMSFCRSLDKDSVGKLSRINCRITHGSGQTRLPCAESTLCLLPRIHAGLRDAEGAARLQDRVWDLTEARASPEDRLVAHTESRGYTPTAGSAPAVPRRQPPPARYRSPTPTRTSMGSRRARRAS